MFWAEPPNRRRVNGLVFAFVFCAIHCSTLHAEKLPVKTYTTADGLGRDQINRIVQDSHGFLWFCTAEGLSRFDGYKFTNYTTSNGLANNAVNDLLETRDGTYLVATANGLSVLNPHGTPMFSNWRAPEKAAEEITVLLEDSKGRIWCGTIAGLYQLERNGAEWSFHFVDLGLKRENYDSWLIEAVIEDRRGSLWIGTRGSGLCRYWQDDRIEHFTEKEGLPNNRVTSLLEDQTGRLWVGTPAGLFRLVNDPKPERRPVSDSFTVKEGLTDNWITTLFQSAEGKIFAATRGLNELVTDQNGHLYFRSFTTAQGLSENHVQTIAEDRDGNLWLGTGNGGAMKIARNGFIEFIHSDGLGEGEIFSIFEDQVGQTCAFLRDRQGHEFIACFDGQRFASVQLHLSPQLHDVGWGFGQQALQDVAGEWWAPTGEGLYRFPSVSRFLQIAKTRPRGVYDSKRGLPSNEVFSLFQDTKGDLWMGSISLSLNGITKWERSKDVLHTFSEADGLPSKNVLPSAFGEDRSGSIWAGLNVGVVLRYREGRFDMFTVSDGSPGGWIRAIYCDHNGRLWISSGQGGVRRIDEPQAEHPKFIPYTLDEGLSSNQVNCITEDQWGRIYFGTGRGLDRLDPNSGHIKHFTTADGLVNGRVRFALRDRSGALWFANETELSRLLPESDRPEPEPPIVIARVQIAGVPLPLSELGESNVGPLELAAGQNQVSIDFVGLEFDPGEALRYQHKLEGADRDWSVPSDQRVINYENLAPGSYRFQVRAVTTDGIMSLHPAIFVFRISPPLWRRWWSLTLAVGLFGFLVYAAHRYRVGRLIELERVRTRIATDLHDDLGSSLSRMAILSEVAKRRIQDPSRDSIKILTDIAESSRKAVESMSDIVWAIDPRRDDLNNVVFRVRQFASDLLVAKDIAWQFQALPDFDKFKLNPEQRRQIFLIFKEAINNSVRHAKCKCLYLSLEVLRSEIVGEIRDDGCGFTVPSLDRPGENGQPGHGLENLRTRATQLGGHLSIVSSPGQGTWIRFSIPLKKAMA